MKKEYKKPILEVVFFRTAEMMWDLEGSGDHAGPSSAPERPKAF